ncbi:MAG: ribonuclease P protein component, partial [Nakamurella sp.]
AVGLSRLGVGVGPMLPAASKLRRSQDFSTVVRSGHRGGTRHLVVHLYRAVGDPPLHPDHPPAAPRAGFVVSTAVGNSVVRHRVTRRLRALVNDRLPALPLGTDLVIRALPAAAAATSSQPATDRDAGLRAAGRKADKPVSTDAGRPDAGRPDAGQLEGARQ